jgi:hypothetical protein
MKNTVKSWSYSRYRDYKQCPFKFKCKHIVGLKEPGNKAMERGSAIGKLAEVYLKSRAAKLPFELALFRQQFAAAQQLCRKNPVTVFVEESWCFDKNGRTVEWNDWNNVWLRIKMDLCGIDKPTNVLVPVDLKTGKYRPDDLGSYLDQLEIYAMGGMQKMPQVVGASPRLWFLDAGVEHPQCTGEELYYPRSDLPLLQKKWGKKVIPIFTDTTFRAVPNSKCCWCHFRKENGGPCKF